MRNERLHQQLLSLQKLAVLAECVRIEFSNELLGSVFTDKTLNNFARRIRSDAEEIVKRLEKSGRYGVRMTEVTEEYSSEVWRVVTLLNGLDVEVVREFADNLSRELEKIEI